MDESERQEYEAKSKDLRADLKRFEADWADQHGGAKPSRDDIKQNADIARKYKKYNHVRDILSGKVPPPKGKEPKTKEPKNKKPAITRKRKSEEFLAETPSKRLKPVETPSSIRQRIIDPELFATPSTTRKLFSPAMPTSIGPTPQRDGRILGLFDLLEADQENTPSMGRHGRLSDGAKVQATPSKKTGQTTMDAIAKLGRTPTSTSKRGTLFMTPSKRNHHSGTAETPSTVRKLQLTTPSFLRRAPLASVDENGEFPRLRLPRKPLGRGLSNMVAGLRKLEEEALDDDLEALHEMEDDADPSSNTTKTAEPTNPTKPKEDILEPDSQAQQLLGGFDDEGLYDSPTEEGLGRDGQPLRVYKKKGQKRTTRRVNMRPTRSKRPQQPTEEQSEDDAEDVVLETQVDATKANDEPLLDMGSDSGSDFDLLEEEDDEPKEKEKKKSSAAKKKQPEKKEGTIKKAARKVNELAHANFKRLKLRNNGAKGSAGGNRFRRRRG